MKKILTWALCMALVLSFAACGSAGTPAKADTAETAVKVTTVDELLNAIAPGATIELGEGTYDLTKAKGFGGKNVSEYYYWESMGDGAQYNCVIERVDGLTLQGSNAKIVTGNSWASVLKLNHCDDLTLSGLSIGHTEEVDSCEGSVINMTACDNALIRGCDLYGCGTVGVEAYECFDLTIDTTDIHHCSSGAVSASNGKQLTLTGCNIYECGKSGDYGAWSVLSLYNIRGVTVSSTRVADSRFDNFISGYFNDGGVDLDDITIENNHFDAFLSLEGRVSFNSLNMAGNVINHWIPDYYTPVVDINGETVTEAGLDERFGDQRAASGVAKVETVPVEISTEGTTVKHVSNADEFISAIASDTTIVIDVEEIDLSTATGYGEGATDFWNLPEDSYFQGKNVLWQEVFDGYALWIGNVSNLHIQGGRIVTQPRYANVLGYYHCNNVSLCGTTVGHTEGSECAGGVVYLAFCADVILEQCDLYGCGIFGIQTMSCVNTHVQNTLIHDCTYGAAVFSNSPNVTCYNVAILSCPSPIITIDNCEQFVWDDTIMDSSCAFDPAVG